MSPVVALCTQVSFGEKLIYSFLLYIGLLTSHLPAIQGEYVDCYTAQVEQGIAFSDYRDVAHSSAICAEILVPDHRNVPTPYWFFRLEIGGVRLKPPPEQSFPS